MDINDIIKIKTAAFFILVVEKESVFHKLIEEDFPNTLAIPFVLITVSFNYINSVTKVLYHYVNEYLLLNLISSSVYLILYLC